MHRKILDRSREARTGVVCEERAESDALGDANHGADRRRLVRSFGLRGLQVRFPISFLFFQGF